MAKINSGIYECDKCGRANNVKHNKTYQENYTILACYFCQAQYKVVSDSLYYIPDTSDNDRLETNDNLKIDDTTEKKVKRKEPSMFQEISLPILALGLFVVVIIGIAIFFTANPSPAGSSNSSIPVINSNEVKSSDVILNNTFSEDKTKLLADCDFTLAKEKALNKVKALDLNFVEDRLEPEMDYTNCKVTYFFYVKKTVYDYQGNSSIDDKVQSFNISYSKIGSNFEFTGASLYNSTNNTVTRF